VLRIAMARSRTVSGPPARSGLIVPRQNGKGEVLLARELAGLFLLGEERITHTAHEFKTAGDAYKRIREIILKSPDLMRRVKRMPNSPIEKGVELKNGNTLSFIARSGGSGRGFSGDVVILDEAYDLTQDHMDAFGPTMTMAKNMQVCRRTRWRCRRTGNGPVWRLPRRVTAVCTSTSAPTGRERAGWSTFWLIWRLGSAFGWSFSPHHPLGA
jgi:hypothetical protein